MEDSCSIWRRNRQEESNLRSLVYWLKELDRIAIVDLDRRVIMVDLSH